jgi:hypothetical protein
MPGKRPADKEIRRLAATSEARYWSHADLLRRRRLRISRAWLTVRDRAAQVRQDGRVLTYLLRSVLAALVVTAVVVAALEAAAGALYHVLHWGNLFEPVTAESYSGFVGAAVGAEAVFLALFFTTVGVIAATTYAQVPAEIRSLFIRERTSLLYVWNVAVALLVGLTLLTMPVVTDREAHGITVLLFAVLTAFSVLSLVLLGLQMFNFFDLSTLSYPLPRRFVQAVKAASAARKEVPAEIQQQAAHDRAAEVLRQYRQLTDLIRGRGIPEANAPEWIARQLLVCWNAASDLKPTIPTKSKWFSLTAAHPNWLTMNHTQLNMALSTRAGVQPTLAPDPLWIEHLIADCVDRLLPTLSTKAEWQRAIRVVDEANDLILYLASRLQLEEARLLRQTVVTYVHVVAGARGESVPGDDGSAADGEEWEVFSLAAADRETLAFTRFWLGLVGRFQQIDSQALMTSFDAAVATAQGPYQSGAPRALLTLFEDIAKGIEFERRTEHQRITPAWWVHHLAARTLTRTLVAAVRDFFEEVQTELIDPLVEDTGASPDVATLRIFDALELAEKLRFHLKTVHRAIEVLDTLRHDPSNDELWPDTALPDDAPEMLEEQLLRKLGDVALHLVPERHDSGRPDLFGQAYKVLFDATFHAILEGRGEFGRKVFPVAIAMAERARTRLIGDLAAERQREQVIFGTEPLVDMMELSGYALLMSELNGEGIWPDVHDIWDRVLSTDTAPALARQLSAVLSAHENLFGLLTSGGIGRTERQMGLGRLLEARGIVDRHDLLPGESAEPEPTSPVIAAFAPWQPGFISHDLADLFIVEYLIKRPDMADIEIPRGAKTLQESLEFHRRRMSKEDPSPSEAGDE